MYLKDGYSLIKAAKMVGIGRKGLTNSLKEEGYLIINRQNETKFNEFIFDIIDLEEKAYWLGFLYADGSVSDNSNTIELSLKTSDISHLHKFRKIILNTKQTCGRLNILGTKNFLNGIINETHWERNKMFNKNNIYSLEWSGYYVYDYLQWIYEDSCVYLDRKYNKYLEIEKLSGCRSKK